MINISGSWLGVNRCASLKRQRRARARKAAFGGAAAGKLLAGCGVHIAEPARRTAASAANLERAQAHSGRARRQGGRCLPYLQCCVACSAGPSAT